MSRQRKSTMIRAERQATNARKRAAFEFQAPIKKPRQSPGSMLFVAAEALNDAPVAKPKTPHYEVLSHEFCQSE